MGEAYFYITIMFVFGTIVLWAIKHTYMRTVYKIVTDFNKDKSSRSELPDFTLNINSAFVWNCVTSIILILASMVHTYIMDESIRIQSDTIEEQYRELQDCKDSAKKEILLELKNATE